MHFTSSIKTQNSRELTFVVKPKLNICKDTAKVFSLPLLKIITKSTHFLPAKKKIPILTPRYQIPTPSGKKFANCKYSFEKCE